MKKQLYLTLIVAAVLAYLGCMTEEEPAMDAIPLDEIDGQRLWFRISEESPYDTYSFWPGHEGQRPGQAPHGEYHRVYVNRTMFNGLPSESMQAPDGAIIVKESLNASRELVSITVMAKVEGFNPAAGDWYWAAYGPDGDERAAGAIEGCILCHQGMSHNDYVIVRPLDAEFEGGEKP